MTSACSAVLKGHVLNQFRLLITSTWSAVLQGDVLNPFSPSFTGSCSAVKKDHVLNPLRPSINATLVVRIVLFLILAKDANFVICL